MDNRVERVAQAIHAAEQQACLWHDEPAAGKDRFREYARNAIILLDEDIDVLLQALKKATAERRLGRPERMSRRRVIHS